jgi:hypothetical protein
MADRDSPSVAALLLWKVLTLPHRRQKPEQRSSSEPRPRIVPLLPERSRVQKDGPKYVEPEPDIRHQPRQGRPLTIVSLCQAEDAGQPLDIEQQSASLLFTLPKEVRLMIYEQVLGGMVLHIIRRENKLGHKLCKTSGDPDQCAMVHCRGFKIPSGLHIGRGNGEIIQILQSCRRV